MSDRNADNSYIGWHRPLYSLSRVLRIKWQKSGFYFNHVKCSLILCYLQKIIICILRHDLLLTNNCNKLHFLLSWANARVKLPMWNWCTGLLNSTRKDCVQIYWGIHTYYRWELFYYHEMIVNSLCVVADIVIGNNKCCVEYCA